MTFWENMNARVKKFTILDVKLAQGIGETDTRNNGHKHMVVCRPISDMYYQTVLCVFHQEIAPLTQQVKAPNTD